MLGEKKNIGFSSSSVGSRDYVSLSSGISVWWLASSGQWTWSRSATCDPGLWVLASWVLASPALVGPGSSRWGWQHWKLVDPERDCGAAHSGSFQPRWWNREGQRKQVQEAEREPSIRASSSTPTADPMRTKYKLMSRKAPAMLALFVSAVETQCILIGPTTSTPAILWFLILLYFSS